MGGLTQYKRGIPGGQSTTIGARGTTVVILSATQPVKITTRSNKVGSQSGEAYSLTMQPGQKIFTSTEFDAVETAFETVRLNESEEPIVESVTLLIGYGDFVFSPPQPGAADYIITGNFPVGFPGSTMQLLSAANPYRKKITLQMHPDNTNPIAIGGSFDASFDTQLFNAGDVVELETRGEVWVSNDGSTGDVVNYREELYNAS